MTMGIMAVGEFAKMLNHPFNPNVFLLNFHANRQFLVSTASEKNEFFFGKSQKLVKTFFFLNAQPSGYI